MFLQIIAHRLTRLRFPSAPVCAFVGSAAVYFAVATMNAWPNLDAALQGDHKAAAMAFVQYTFAFIVAISPVASAHEKGGQAAVLVFMLAVLPGKAKTLRNSSQPCRHWVEHDIRAVLFPSLE